MDMINARMVEHIKFVVTNLCWRLSGPQGLLNADRRNRSLENFPRALPWVERRASRLVAQCHNQPRYRSRPSADEQYCSYFYSKYSLQYYLQQHKMNDEMKLVKATCDIYTNTGRSG
jgi:hypothetical protein